MESGFSPISGTSSKETPAAYASRKSHFLVLDGLRGTAAIMVVFFHILEMRFALSDPSANPLRHSYLAVDFFFLLSGFVVSHAYDDRWGHMGLGAFFRTRLIRLHPAVVLGVLIGLVAYLADPFLAVSPHPTAASSAVAISLVAGLLLLPSPSLPGRFTETYSLNGPHWTLAQEYLANIAYALVLRRLGTGALAVVALLAAIGLAITAQAKDGISTGYNFETLWVAPVRVGFPFIAGMLLYRTRHRWQLPQLGMLPLSLALIVLFCVPILPPIAGISLNGIFDTLCVLAAFPLIVACGANSPTGPFMQRLCDRAGRLSYPLYASHYPFMWVYLAFIAYTAPPAEQMNLVGWALAPFLLIFGWLVTIWYDEPVRHWLRRKMQAKA